MDNSWTTSIEKLMLWRASSWRKHDSTTTKWTLRIVYDILLITAETKIFESISLRSKIKGIYKEDIIILIVCGSNQKVWKLKFQIKDNVAECLEKLGQYFPVVKHNATSFQKAFESQFRNIKEVMRTAVEGIGSTGSLPLPPDFKNFVTLCLLDPNMAQVINDTQKILDDLNKS